MGNFMGDGLPEQPELTGVRQRACCEPVTNINSSTAGAHAEKILARKIRKKELIARKIVSVFADGHDTFRLASEQTFDPIVYHARNFYCYRAR